MTQDNMTFNHSLYHRVTNAIEPSQCHLIHDYFYHALKADPNGLIKTHFLHGRYENIYLKNNQFEPLIKLLNNAKYQAALLLKCRTYELSMDFWFNDMPPNHITAWHRHDVLDERLSAVFYVTIPAHSGKLLLKDKPTTASIIPKENDLLFFKPNINHCVEENKSSQSRLSIGMNFGFLCDKEND